MDNIIHVKVRGNYIGLEHYRFGGRRWRINWVSPKTTIALLAILGAALLVRALVADLL